jgi:hypothetical protein
MLLLMGIERVGRQFIEVQDEDGNRSIVCINAIQQALEMLMSCAKRPT